MPKGNNRKLKVYYGYGRNYKQIPVIHLAGQFLKKAGFEIGDSIKVVIDENMVTIIKLDKLQTSG